MICLQLAILLSSTASATTSLPPIKGDLSMHSITNANWQFEGEIGRRVDANIENWILRTPDANPGLLDMFRRRNRELSGDPLVPWAGEFAGKYLISAVQACHMSDDTRLRPFVQDFVDALVACQAPNGYLGAFSESEQLLGNWDLWNHYHVMTGLLMWYDMTGDKQAFDATVRAADLMCEIYGPEGRRPIEAGSPECNLAVLTVLLDLYRRTGEPQYRDLCLRIEQDMEKAGDWLRAGAAGIPYYALLNNGTRWESLHIVQGFATLYELTGKEMYKDATVHLWDSIRARDRHPSGAFSTHERAFGSPYAIGSIETCCSIAWAALSIDVLRLTGDPAVADELELSTWNQLLAAQHPSGSWCTYDNPLDGVRVPSFQSIAFQYRPGTGELNCCSVNASRGIGMLPDWAVMKDDTGLIINFYGPMQTAVALEDGTKVTVAQQTGYPVDGHIRVGITPAKKKEFALRLRIPEWSPNATVNVNGEAWPSVEPGTYLTIERAWKKGDRVDLTLDMGLRYWAGDSNRKGYAALYAGPLLLALDTAHNPCEVSALKPIDLAAVTLEQQEITNARTLGVFPPMGLWRITGSDQPVVLCDFASAGSMGTKYMAWLPATHAAPPPICLEAPVNGAVAAPGPVTFAWASFGPPAGSYELTVARTPTFENPIVHLTGLTDAQVLVADVFSEDGVYYWKVSTENAYGRQESKPRDCHFVVDSSQKYTFHDLDAARRSMDIDDQLHPFLTSAETSILSIKDKDIAFDEEVWLEYSNPDAVSGAGLFSAKQDTDSPVVWRLQNIPPGAYQLDTWIPLDPHANHATDASYCVIHADGKTVIPVNLAAETHRWHTLGKFNINADSQVVVSNMANKFVSVEAIRLKRAKK